MLWGYCLPLKSSIRAPQLLISLTLLVVFSLATSTAIAQELSLEQRYERAAELLHAGNLSLAESEFQEVIRAAPQAPEPYYFLARIYEQTQRSNEAEKLLETSVALKPDFVEAWQSLGLLYAQQESYGRAKDAFLKVLELKPGSAQAHFNLGLTLEKLGDDSGALREFEAAFKHAVDDSRLRLQAQTNLGFLHLKRARTYTQSDQLSAALRDLELAQDLLPPSFELYDLLGGAYLKAKDLRAVEASRKAVELNPTEQAWERLSQALLANGKVDEAVEVFSQKVKEQPQNLLFHVLLGSAFWDRSEYLNALDQYQQAATLSPSSARAQYLVGFMHQMLGNLSAAKSSLELALRLDPEFVPANLTMGELLAGEGKWHEALPFLEKVAQNKNNDLGVRLKLGQLYLDHGKLEQARVELQAAERLALDDKKVHYLLGRLYTALNQPDLAKREFSIFSQLEALELEKKRAK